MKRRILISGAVLMAAAALFYLTREPIVHGRFLTSWMRELYYASGDMTKPDPAANRVEAENAIRSLGTNAIPTLLAELHASDDELWQRWRFSLHGWTASVRHVFHGDYYDNGPSFVANERRHAAVLGFQALGRTALPWLCGLIADPKTDWQTATYVALVLKDSQPDGCALLLPVLNNPNRETRMGVMTGLEYSGFTRTISTNFVVWIPSLLEILGDTSKDRSDRISAASLLAMSVAWGSLQMDEQIVPALIKQIPDRSLPGIPASLGYLKEERLRPYYHQLLDLAKSGTLNPTSRNQLLRLMKIKVPEDDLPVPDNAFLERYHK